MTNLGIRLCVMPQCQIWWCFFHIDTKTFMWFLILNYIHKHVEGYFKVISDWSLCTFLHTSSCGLHICSLLSEPHPARLNPWGIGYVLLHSKWVNEWESVKAPSTYREGCGVLGAAVRGWQLRGKPNLLWQKSELSGPPWPSSMDSIYPVKPTAKGKQGCRALRK